MNEKIQAVVSIVEAIFYIVTGSIALLTFLIARRTVLQPIKTEVFKKQIDIATDIMNLFNGKNELDIRKAFGFDLMEHANICNMLDTYAQFFFDIKIDGSKRPYNKDACPCSIVSSYFMEHYFEPVLSPGEEIVHENIEPEDGPETISKEEKWKSYTYGIICQPRKTTCMLDQLDEIMKSPFLPHKAVQLLAEIKETVHRNSIKLGEVLTEVSQQLPIFYPDLESMKTANMSWISQKYAEEFIPMEKSCNDLTEYLREYFHVESIMK